MKYALFLTVFLCAILNVHGQFASFEAETFLGDIEEYELKELQGMVWIIKGEAYRYGDIAVKVPVNPSKVDTMFYQRTANSRWDTILYKITEERAYVFNVNTCCGGFDVRPKYKSTKKSPWNRNLNFRIKGGPADLKLLATHSSAGSRVMVGEAVRLKATCHSAMAPNIYRFSLLRFTECEEEGEDCQLLMCLQSKEDYDYDFYYREVEIITSGLYMPLGNAEMTVLYDFKTGQTSFR